MGCGGKLEKLRTVSALLAGMTVSADVYCQPFEGALLIVPRDGSHAVAFDRFKRASYLLKQSDLVIHSESVIEVPTATKEVDQGDEPVFEVEGATATFGNKVYEVRWSN